MTAKALQGAHGMTASSAAIDAWRIASPVASLLSWTVLGAATSYFYRRFAAADS